MTKFNFYVSLALKSLQRDFRYSILAVLCIAFGVLSILAMGVLADSMINTIDVPNRTFLGRDVSFGKEKNLTEDDVYKILEFERNGQIKNAVPIITNGIIYVKKDYGKIQAIFGSGGIDPKSYPLVGNIELASGKKLSEIDLSKENILLTEDVTTRLKLKVGDSVSVVGLSNTVLQMRVVDIVTQNPTHSGGTAYMGYESARIISDLKPNTFTSVYALYGNNFNFEEATKKLGDEFWVNESINFNSSENSKRAIDLFHSMLSGVGMLGLVVGSIGIINAFMVIIKRRSADIAILRTVGYTAKDLFIIFAIEFIIIGILGSILGVATGTLVAILFVTLFKKIGSMLVVFVFSPVVFAASALAGIATSLLFGLISVNRQIYHPPIAVIRNETEVTNKIGKKDIISIVIGFIVFGAIASLVAKDLLVGFAIVIVSIIIILLFRLIGGWILILFTYLPWPLPRSMHLSKLNIRRNALQLIFPIFALFIGSAVVGLVATVNVSIHKQVKENTDPEVVSEYSSTVYTTSEWRKVAEDAMKERANGIPYSLLNIVGTASVFLDKEGDITLLGVSQSSTGIPLYGNPLGSIKNGVYIQRDFDPDSEMRLSSIKPIPIGSKTQITINGKTTEVTVAGYLEVRMGILSNEWPVAIDIASFDEIVGNQHYGVTLQANMPEEKSKDLSETLMKTSNGKIFVTSSKEEEDLSVATIDNLARLAIGIATLALVAGLVLMINVLGLTLLQRRRDIAVLKSLGYTNGQVMSNLLIEFGFAGLIAGVAAIGAIPLMVYGLNIWEPHAKLTTEPSVLLTVFTVSIALSLVTTFLISLQPVQVKPLEVLRGE